MSTRTQDHMILDLDKILLVESYFNLNLHLTLNIKLVFQVINDSVHFYVSHM